MSNESWPIVALSATAAVVEPGQRLPLAISVSHGEPEPLGGLQAELTLEVERGVLVTWNLALAPVASGEVADFASDPPFELPLNVATGNGRFWVTLTGADGAQLSEASLDLPVAAG